VPDPSFAFIDGMLDQMQSGESSSPISQHLDMNLVSHGRGEVTYEMAVRRELSNPLGVVQGGIVTVLADAAMAAATSTMLTDEEATKEAITTVDLHSRFLRPVNLDSAKVLRADARVVRAGRQLVWAECDVSADGKEVGKFTATGVRVPFKASEAVMEESSSD
jgi:uncharacterized protein (TIGR00369 family)